jgi:aryl-alcohol dehydrogenase-like predicted oxidoreductase
MTDAKPFALDNYRLLGRSGLRVSPLCLGTMTFGTAWGWGADYAESERQLATYAERGGNFIDTANLYTGGESEEYLGRLLAGRRERFVLATKYSFGARQGDPNSGGNHRKNMFQAVEESLRRLHTDYIDLYWLHVWEYRTPIEEVMRAVDDLVRQGKILYFGFSDTPAWKIAEANTLARLMGWTPAIAAQMEYSLIERGVEREIAPMCRELGLGLTPWSPLGAGLLTGKYLDNEAGESPRAQGVKQRLTERNIAIAREVVAIAQAIERSPAQVAINWLLCQPGVASPILGARTADQLIDCLWAADFVLDAEHLERLNQVSSISLGFPSTFWASPLVQGFLSAGCAIEPRDP